MIHVLTRLIPVCVTVLGLAAAPAGAESLEEAWRTALAQDLALRASRDHVEAAAEDLAAARSARLPNVSANAGITRFNEAPAFDFSGAGIPVTLPLFGDENMEMAGASVSLPLFAGGSINGGIDAASAALHARTAQADVAAQQVKLDVVHHCINVLRAKRALEVADSTVKSLEAHVADVQDMFESGAVARNDFLSAAVSLADSEQRRLQAGNALDLANAAYNRALGRDLGAPVDLDENLPEVDSHLDLDSLESLTRTAVGSRHELGQYEAAADALRSQSRATRGKTRPQLALTGGYTSLQNEFLNRDDFWMVGIGVQWNLFDGGQTRRKANALSYRNGEGTNTEVLDAETLRALSHSNYDNAHFDARLALYELARGVGRL